MNFLLDTNVIANHFKDIYEGDSRTLVDSVINQSTHISVITRIELLSWRSLLNEEVIIIESFIRDSIVFSLNEAIILKTIEIRKSRRIKIPDAIIAATAIIHGLQLLTHNTNDFINIPALTVINPANPLNAE